MAKKTIDLRKIASTSSGTYPPVGGPIIVVTHDVNDVIEFKFVALRANGTIELARTADDKSIPEVIGKLKEIGLINERARKRTFIAPQLVQRQISKFERKTGFRLPYNLASKAMEGVYPPIGAQTGDGIKLIIGYKGQK